jgi:hypothetical protein
MTRQITTRWHRLPIDLSVAAVTHSGSVIVAAPAEAGCDSETRASFGDEWFECKSPWSTLGSLSEAFVPIGDVPGVTRRHVRTMA